MKIGFEEVLSLNFMVRRCHRTVDFLHIVTLITHLDCLIQYQRLLSINAQVVIDMSRFRWLRLR